MNYYNEFDPKAAEWLRELIAGGHIPAGEVDERSICDVSASELSGFTQCHFFCGIGGWPLALALAGWPEDRPVWTGSCPCQPFSDGGKRKGFRDDRHLWPVWFPLIRECAPPVVIGEQVASKLALDWLDGVFADLEGQDYACAAADLCSAGVNAPHIRQRLFWVADADLSVGNGRPRIGEQSLHEAHAGTGGLADTSSQGSSYGPLGGVRCEEESRGAWNGESQRCCPTCRMADSDRRECDGFTDGEGREPDRAQAGRQQGDGQLECNCSNGGLAISESERRDGSAGAAEPAGRGVLEAGRGLGDPIGSGLEGLAGNGDGGNESGWLDQVSSRPASTAGIARYWDAYDIVACRDGKARRIEPGSFPLAHGISGRVGLLRGYGNAINPYLAAEFVAAYLEAKREGVK